MRSRRSETTYPGSKPFSRSTKMHYCLMTIKNKYVITAKSLDPDVDEHEFDLLAKRFRPGRVLGRGDSAGAALGHALRLAEAAQGKGA